MNQRDTQKALSYFPAILVQLDDTGKDLFAQVCNAMLLTGYEDGFRDGAHSRMSETEQAFEREFERELFEEKE